MELGDATVLMDTSSGEVSPAGVNRGEGREGGGEEKVEKINLNGGGGGGNRWPRQETLALLKIRSDMDGVFRDASLKGPLWQEVSRKLAQLGYQRNAKKCKEKFENVYKYHRRTKESRSGKSEGKTYRFFDQLQALEKPFTLSSFHPPKPQPATLPITNNPLLTLPSTDPISHVTVPSTNPTTLISPSPPKPSNATTTIISTTLTTNPTNPSQDNNNNNNNNGNTVQYSLPNMNLFSTTTTTSTSSSTASDEDLEEKYRKKRKWKDYFRRLTREVLAKQEEMQKRFLESIDKREREQMAQQDAWRLQEMARINREHDLLVQECSTAAAKNAAVIAFLQKLSTHQNPTTPPPQQQQQPRTPPPPQQAPPPTAAPSQPPISQPQVPNHQPLIVIPQPNNNVEVKAMNNGHRNSGSRWPKPEVHALIRLRTSLEPKYLENGPKAPLWEDISAGMQRLGYNRSSKRCKEKWENINKYFKKVKESNKQRREDSKTCPYFHELEALYKEKGKTQNAFGSGSLHNMKQNEMMEPLMVQPEQQWRPPPAQESNVVEKKNEEVIVAEGGEEEEKYDDEDEYESMEEDEQGYDDEVTTNKLSSVDIVE